MTKTQFSKKLRKYVYWHTKKDSTEVDLQIMIVKWLAKNPEGVDYFIQDHEKWFESLKGAMQGRKEDLLLIKTK
jgi:hypothetical protein